MKKGLTVYLPYYKSVLRLGTPLLLGQLGVILTGFMDTMMVGRYSTDSLAAASFVNSLFNLTILLSLGFSYGLTPIAGAAYARGEYKKLGGIVKNALIANSAYGLIVLLCMTALYFNLHRLGQPEELLPLMRPYYAVVLVSIVPMIIINVLRQFTDGITDTKMSMWILTGGNILNVVGNWLLIYGKLGFPELGLYGAGVSTLVSRVAMLAAYLLVLLSLRRYKPFLCGFIEENVNRASMRRIASLSLPISLQMGMETGLFTFASVLVGWLGAAHLAAYQIIIILGNVGFMVYYSFGAGMSIKIANCVGVGDIEGVRRSANAGYHVILLCAAVASVSCAAVARQVIAIFTADGEVTAIALSLIIPWMLYQLGDATQVAFANALRGISRVVPIMRYAFLSYVAVGMPLCYVTGILTGAGIVGIFVAFAVALLLAGMLFWHTFRQALRKNLIH